MMGENNPNTHSTGRAVGSETRDLGAATGKVARVDSIPWRLWCRRASKIRQNFVFFD